MRKAISLLMALLLAASLPLAALALEVDNSYGNVSIGDTHVGHHDSGGNGTGITFSKDAVISAISYSNAACVGNGHQTNDVLEGNVYDATGPYTTGSLNGHPGEMEPPKEPAASSAAPAGETFWGGVLKQLKAARSGDTVTVDAGGRTTMPATIVETLQELGVTLVIQWDGGEDISIGPDFGKAAVGGVYLLADL